MNHANTATMKTQARAKINRKLLFNVVVVLAGIFAFCAAMSAIGWLGYAHAQGVGSGSGLIDVGSGTLGGSGSVVVAPVTITATPDIGGLLGFLTTGKYLAAVGAGLVIVIGLLRNYVLAKVKFFQSQTGGYVLGWGVTTVIYVATALQAGQSITLSLLGTAAGAGLAASGALDHFRDVVNAMNKPIVASPASITKVGLVLILASGLVLGSCGVTGSEIKQNGLTCAGKQASASLLEQVAIDLFSKNSGDLEALALSNGLSFVNCLVTTTIATHATPPATGSATKTEAPSPIVTNGNEWLASHPSPTDVK